VAAEDMRLPCFSHNRFEHVLYCVVLLTTVYLEGTGGKEIKRERGKGGTESRREGEREWGSYSHARVQ
jgi:hypothetical protein